MEEQLGNFNSPCPVGLKHSNLNKSFKLGIRSMLTTCSKQDFFKAFSSFNKSKQDALYSLFTRVHLFFFFFSLGFMWKSIDCFRL
ncbi:hypothetical protein AQUCO_00100691v1 [Aquilegia coerulea]|uniref:Uncharacterized protein n=1 Tax=Aquilegia coerulea TaxID=218851 RepID=A0A2G5FBP6_AQUCA|nr:hypothetical protein AQUCO_00100691v1 [Aquilegia coerulea]